MADNDKVADSGVPEEGIAESVDQSQEEEVDVTSVAGTEESPVDLSNHPQFRKMQSEYQQRLARAEQQLQYTNQQMQELATQGLSEDELSDYEYRQMQQQLQELQAVNQELTSAQARQQALTEIANKAKVPVSAIQDAQSPDEAWEMAINYRDKAENEKVSKRAKAKAKKTEANEVVIGGGKASSSQDDWEKEIDSAFQSGRTVDFVRALRKQPT